MTHYGWLPLVIAGGFAAFLSAMVTLKGNPTVIDGGYYLNDHGTLLQVTYHGFEVALAAQDRVYTSFPGIFYAIGLVANIRTPAALTTTGRSRAPRRRDRAHPRRRNRRRR